MGEQGLIAVLEYMQKTSAPKNADEVSKALDMDQSVAENSLRELLEQGKLIRTKRGKYASPAQIGGVVGRLVGLRRGDAYFVPLDGSEEMFIRETQRNTAMHGDTVVARRTQKSGIGRKDNGEIVSVTTRAHETVVGTVMIQNGGGVLIPDDRRICDIQIPTDKLNNAQSRQMALVRITDYGSDTQPMCGEVEQIFGEEGTIKAGIAVVIHEYNLLQEFKPRTLSDAHNVPQEVTQEQSQNREDYRDLCTVTIDGADAKDFDDAISLTKTDKGYTLYVHIADVTHYVKENSALDKESYTRATSVYFPGAVLPMLPEALSNGICSLKEGVDRLCLTCIMNLDVHGQMLDYRFARGIIRSAKRCVYEQVNVLSDEEKDPLMEQYGHVWPMLQEMIKLSVKLTKLRVLRGALDFDLSEPTFTLNEEGDPVAITPSMRGIANQMIEEFMLLANECAAKYVKERGLPALYRIHEDPDQERIQSFGLLLKALGLPGWKKTDRVTPRTLQSILHKVAGEPYELAVSRVMLRTLQKAKYSDQPIGHFGLALKDYCHFTSPIRRYPDIVIHRAIIASLEGGLAEKASEQKHALMPSMGAHTSERERASMEAERAVDDLYCAAYMKGKIGERYKGFISGVAEFGIFVEILGAVEGMIPLGTLGEDVFQYDEVLYRITGRHTGVSYTLGDEMEIVVAGADMIRRRVDFVPYKAQNKPVVRKGNNQAGNGKGKAKGKGKSAGGKSRGFAKKR